MFRKKTMQLPADPFDLISPQSPDFRVDGWEYDFGPFHWFYVVGAPRLLARAGISDLSVPANEAGTVAVPAEWAATYPTFDWTVVAQNQVRRAIKQKPMTFHKACLAVAAIVNAVNRHGVTNFAAVNQTAQAERWIRIKPATFEIVGYGSHTHLRLQGPDLLLVLAAGFQLNPQFLKDIGRGHGATFLSLDGIAGALHSRQILEVHAVSGKDRRSHGALGPTKVERVVYQTDPATGEIL
jgi:hypothetical protein